MSASLESAVERQKRREREIKIAYKERLRQHGEKRRARRHNLRSRLRYATDVDGWRLMIPPSRRGIRTIAISALALIAALSFAVLLFGADRGYFRWAMILLFGSAPAYVLYLFVVAFKGSVTFQVAKDGGFALLGWRSGLLLHRGSKADCSVTINYAYDTALANIWLPGDEVLRDFGERDLSILKSFCDVAGVAIASKSAKFATLSSDEADAHGIRSIEERQSAKSAIWWGVVLTAIVLGLFFLALALVKHESSLGGTDDESFKFSNKSLTGSFRSTNKELGEWTLTPSACLSGRERGFDGIAFQFPVGGPVEEIRMDTARKGDNVVEIRLADRKGTVARFRERECQAMEGEIEQSSVEITGRPMLRLKGHGHFSCPAHGLAGDYDFDGCLPQ